MPTHLELLKAKLAAYEAAYGPDNPDVKGLKAQIVKYEKSPTENPVEIYAGGFR